MTIVSLKRVGIDEAFVAQEAADQETEFQHAFTLELLLSAGFALVLLAAAPGGGRRSTTTTGCWR
jgi:hypothetical protein